MLQHASVPGTRASLAPPVTCAARGTSGAPLDATTRGYMESRFGHDFTRVRVHAGPDAAEATRAVNARAYTVGSDIVFGAGQYRPDNAAGRRLIAHELGHVVQQLHASPHPQNGPLRVGDRHDASEREASRAADAVTNGGAATPLTSTSPPMLRRDTTTVQVETTKPGARHADVEKKELTLGSGGAGGVVYDYPALARKEPDGDKPGKTFSISLPVIVYPPATIKGGSIDVFVFFHGMRATYGEGPSQGWEPIGIWTHLKEAVAGTDRLGIAPQAPVTWKSKTKKVDDPDRPGAKKDVVEWNKVTAQWHQALGNVGFDGLITGVLARLSKDLGLATPLTAGNIHVAGHSAGGQGIIEAIDRAGGAKTLGDTVQDLTLQDAGYGDAWLKAVDWMLDGAPGKTVRVLMSAGGGGTPASPGDTRSVLTSALNVASISAVITNAAKDRSRTDRSDTFEVSSVPVPAPEDQKPRPGGFVLESQIVVKNKQSGVVQATIVAFSAPGGGHYETATATMRASAAAGPATTTNFLGEARPGPYRVISTQSGMFQDKQLTKPVKEAGPGGRGSVSKVLKRDDVVDVTALELEALPARATAPPRYIARIKVGALDGWTPLNTLTPQ